MMREGTIEVRNLAKRYRIGKPQRYRTLRDSIAGIISAPFRAGSRAISAVRTPDASSSAGSASFIWALQDVSLDIARGEVVGIIGRNGAGKSTLLKILSRVTEPTAGEARVYGRMSSLLEVGTGFHPELTGRENVFLSGAILGMSRAEIRRTFDEIVAFAGVEEFVDTPVKHYSSGMYVRLGFAVAAHLQADILVVDEVLAVGDAAFQARCLGKMSEIGEQGRTVLFVSHNMGAISRLCSTAYLLDRGRVVGSGSPVAVIDRYYESMSESRSALDDSRPFPDVLGFTRWSVGARPEEGKDFVFSGDPCELSFLLDVRVPVRQVYFGLAVFAADGLLIWAMRSEDQNNGHIDVQPGRYVVWFALPALPLRPGRYRLQVTANAAGMTRDDWHVEPALTILPKHESGLPPRWQGILNLEGHFEISRDRSGERVSSP